MICKKQIKTLVSDCMKFNVIILCMFGTWSGRDYKGIKHPNSIHLLYAVKLHSLCHGEWITCKLLYPFVKCLTTFYPKISRRLMSTDILHVFKSTLLHITIVTNWPITIYNTNQPSTFLHSHVFFFCLIRLLRTFVCFLSSNKKLIVTIFQ